MGKKTCFPLRKSVISCVIMISIAVAFGPHLVWSAESRTKISFWAWDLIADVSVKLEKSFEEKYPNIDLEIVKFGIWDVHDKLSVALAAGTGAPDVSELVLRRFSDFSSTGQLLDLTDRFGKYEGKFIETPWNGMKYKGKLYGVPINSSPGLAFYRVDILDQFKIKPGDLKTWDSLIVAGKKVTDEKAGRYMTFLSSPAEAYATDPWSIFLSSMNGNIFDEQGNVIRNNKTAEKAFKFWYDLAYVHKIAKPEPFGRPAFWSFVKTNNLCVFPWAAAILGVLKTQVPEQSGKWRAMAWPTWQGQKTPEVGDLGSCIVTIPKQGKNYNLAATWVEYLCTNLEAQKAVYQTGLVPAYKLALEADFMNVPDPYIGGQVFAEVIKSQNAVNFNWFYWTQTSTIIGAELDAMLAKKKGPEQAWKDAENLLATQLKK